ncbi:hypothetical protein PsorP6_011268 [Peronosclerospora sorghi]|uniref:Uncharacterized protein n=1 Tax=Peronosclerospora sorghi TaxID=230839 RepID=A0ACC0WIT3_9STRA|nr:hypothetical protein PsorP6_011268 [Peronosclerospora sorghi]
MYTLYTSSVIISFVYIPEMTGKRKRSEAFSAHEKLVHKSCALLQREAKKVRTFLVRKLVQQLKTLRQQLNEPVPDATKQQQRELKVRESIHKLEREQTVLKALDLRKLVDRASEWTGLVKLRTKDEEQDVAVKAGKQAPVGETKRGDKDEREHEAKTSTTMKPLKTEEDRELVEKLMDRVLSHKQLMPVLEAIKKLVENEEKDMERKRRAQEKRALKRGRREALVANTGRSGVAPTSLFLGSLSGGGEREDGWDDGTMADADDDIAEFLGEKKKNRPGQMARRMKAIRKEEAMKRREDRVKGIRVPFHDHSNHAGKFGRSERPRKKTKEKVKPSKKERRETRDGHAHTVSKGPCAVQPPAPAVKSAHPSWLAKQMQKEKEKITSEHLGNLVGETAVRRSTLSTQLWNRIVYDMIKRCEFGGLELGHGSTRFHNDSTYSSPSASCRPYRRRNKASSESSSSRSRSSCAITVELCQTTPAAASALETDNPAAASMGTPLASAEAASALPPTKVAATSAERRHFSFPYRARKSSKTSACILSSRDESYRFVIRLSTRRSGARWTSLTTSSRMASKSFIEAPRPSAAGT